MLAADGWFEAQVRALQQSLRTRCFALVEAANVHLRGLVTFRVPAAGMFLWCSLVAPATTAASLIDGMRQHGVCVLPGGFASVTKGATSTYVRLSYVINEEQYDEGTRRLARLVGGLAEPAGDAAVQTDRAEGDTSGQQPPATKRPRAV